VIHVAPWGALFGGYPGVEPADPAVMVDEARRWLDALVAANPGVDGVLLEGYPPAVACEWAAREGVDLMVAASSRGLVDRVLLGSFAGYLLRHAPGAVLLTRPGDPANMGASPEEAR
jgi:nucleotide-binding universal stress UspA family protein